MKEFTPEQLQYLELVYGLKPVVQEEVLPVRDGFVTKETMVWWRASQGPEHTKAGDADHWQNIRSYPQVYSLAKPRVRRTEYQDE